ncbi:uncharacterized protein IAS62_005383 [Cryptococcus decagattii]|uniref:WD40 repeat-like protein n=1 Tax=Cryptococcus decagattii TaxID=1859122 RepID=A0ABZ2AZQ6_9TREE
MHPHRPPLAPIPQNKSSSSSSSSSDAPSTPTPKCYTSSIKRPSKLAPIFLSKRVRTEREDHENIPSSVSVKKRMQLAGPSSISPLRAGSRAAPIESSAEDDSQSSDDQPDSDDDHRLYIHRKSQSIHDYFLPSTSRYGRVKDERQEKEKDIRVIEPVTKEEGVWKRKRRRLGAKGQKCPLSKQLLIPPLQTYLSTLLHSLVPYHPLRPPASILLPSIHPPTGRPRDFAPPLAVSFNHIAKQYTSFDARSQGLRRLIGIAGEEGGVRIVDVDEGLGMHREEKGWWWRAHGNAIFDLKWSRDDTKVLTASGDQTSRLHALTTPTPTLLATLRGHTSSVKTVTFLDPSRSANDPSQSSVIASGGRDGNILIYDVRTKGRDPELGEYGTGPVRREGSRERYRDGIPGFAPQTSGEVLDPVMVIKGAHGNGKRSGRTATRSVTCLLALSSIPGTLASGGSFDGIIKLWDLRFPSATNRSSNPRPTCTPSGSLPDATLSGESPAKRARSINAMVESPVNGDVYALCGDSRIHVLRPSAALTRHHPAWSSGALNAFTEEEIYDEAVQPATYSDPSMLISNFYIRLSLSPDGRYLAAGSCKGGLMTWDTQERGQDIDGRADASRTMAKKLGMGIEMGMSEAGGKDREVCAVEWGKDILAATSDGSLTRIWRSEPEIAKQMAENPGAYADEWVGAF